MNKTAKLSISLAVLSLLAISGACNDLAEQESDDGGVSTVRLLPVGSPCGVWRDEAGAGTAEARARAFDAPDVIFFTLPDVQQKATCSDAIALSNSPGWAGKSYVHYVVQSYRIEFR